MATTNGNRKILDLKRWEFCTQATGGNGTGTPVISSRHNKQQQLYLRTSNEAYMYNPAEDGWITLPVASLAGSFGAGTAGTCVAWSTGTSVSAVSLSATTGTVSSITTNQPLARDLRGYHVQFLVGPNAGKIKEIAYNTVGPSAVVTFTSSESSAFDNTTTYRLLTPRFFINNGGAPAAGSHKFYDYATNTWNTVTNGPATFGTDARMIATPSFMGSSTVYFASGTATGATATTLQNSGKNWTTNQWTNYQVTIRSGTGAGQIRTITSNDATSITVATWTITPSTDSTYEIQGNDDYIYLMGNNAITMYRYSITAATWTTLSPVAARGGGAALAHSGHWIWGVNDSRWTDESSIINGRRIYSFRGGGSNVLDYYDIPSNSWTSTVPYAPATETFTTGTKYAYNGNYLYIQKDATGRWFRYSFNENNMDGWTTMLYTQGGAVVGDTAFDVEYTDGATKIVYIYMMLNTSAILLRQMVI